MEPVVEKKTAYPPKPGTFRSPRRKVDDVATPLEGEADEDAEAAGWGIKELDVAAMAEDDVARDR